MRCLTLSPMRWESTRRWLRTGLPSVVWVLVALMNMSPVARLLRGAKICRLGVWGQGKIVNTYNPGTTTRFQRLNYTYSGIISELPQYVVLRSAKYGQTGIEQPEKVPTWVEGLEAGHPALRRFTTVNRTICGDQIPASTIERVYEWQPLIDFLAAAMDKPQLYPMADPLGRLNVMAYREGERLNWHFDRAEFNHHRAPAGAARRRRFSVPQRAAER